MSRFTKLQTPRDFFTQCFTAIVLALFVSSMSEPVLAQGVGSEASCSSLFEIERELNAVHYPPVEEIYIQRIAHGADGDFVAVGFPAASWTDPDDTSHSNTGYVNIMDRQEGGTWEQSLILPPASELGGDLENNLYFGNALDYHKDAVSGEETLLIGAKGKDPTNEGNGLTTNCGAVYIYERSPGAPEFSLVQSLYAAGCQGNEWPSLQTAFRFGTKVKFDRANPNQFAVSSATDNTFNATPGPVSPPHGSISVYTKAVGSSTWDLTTTVYPVNDQTHFLHAETFDFHDGKLVFTRTAKLTPPDSHTSYYHPVGIDVFDVTSDTLDTIDIAPPEDLSAFPRHFDTFFLEGSDLIVVGERTHNEDAGGVHIYRDESDGSFTQLGTVEAEPNITEHSTHYFGDHLLVAENSFLVILGSHIQRFKVDVQNGSIGSLSDISYSDAIFHRSVGTSNLYSHRVVNGNSLAKGGNWHVEVIDLEKLSNPVRLESVSNSDFKLNCREPIPLIETVPQITIDEEFEEYILSSAADKFLGYTDLTGTVYDPLTDWCQQQSDCSVGTIVPEMTINDHVVTLTLNGNPGEYNFTHTQHPVHMGENNLMSVRVKNGAGYADRVRVLYSLEYPVEHYFQPEANPNDILLAYDDSTKEKPKDVTPFKAAVESEEPELTMRATRRLLSSDHPDDSSGLNYYSSDLVSNVRIALEDASLAGTPLSARLVLRDGNGENPRFTSVELNEHTAGEFRQIGTLLLGHYPSKGYMSGGDYELPDDERLVKMLNRSEEYPSLLYIETGGSVEINIVPTSEVANHNPTIYHTSTVGSRGIVHDFKDSQVFNLFELSEPSPTVSFETAGMEGAECSAVLENLHEGSSTDITDWLVRNEDTGEYKIEGAPPFPEGRWTVELVCQVSSALSYAPDTVFRNLVHGFTGNENSAFFPTTPSAEPVLAVMTDEEAMELAYHSDVIVMTIPNDWGETRLQYFLHVVDAEAVDIRRRAYDNVRWLVLKSRQRTAKQLLARLEDFGVDKLPVYGHKLFGGLTFPAPEEPAPEPGIYGNFGLFMLAVKTGIDTGIKNVLLSPLALIPPDNAQLNVMAFGGAIVLFGRETEQMEDIAQRLGAFHRHVDTLYANPFEEHERSYLDVVEVFVTDAIEGIANLPKTTALRLGRAYLIDDNVGEEIGELLVEVGTMDLGMRLPGIPSGAGVKFPPHSLTYKIMPQWGNGIVALETVRETALLDAPGVGVIPPGVPVALMVAGGDDDVPDEPSPDGEHGPQKRVYDDEHYLTNPEWFDSPIFDAPDLLEPTKRPIFGDVTVVRGERLPDGTYAPGKVYSSGGNDYYSSIGSHDSSLTWDQLMFVNGGDLSSIQTIDVPTTYRPDQIATFDSPLFRWEIDAGELPYGIQTGRQARLYRKPKNPPVENPTVEDYDYFYSEWQGGDVPGANGRFGHAWFPEWFQTHFAFEASYLYSTMPLQQFVELGGKFSVDKVGRLHRRILHPHYDPDFGTLVGQVPMRIITEIDLLTSKPILYDIRPDLGLDLP